jgi:hypothetical protein
MNGSQATLSCRTRFLRRLDGLGHDVHPRDMFDARTVYSVTDGECPDDCFQSGTKSLCKPIDKQLCQNQRYRCPTRVCGPQKTTLLGDVVELRFAPLPFATWHAGD